MNLIELALAPFANGVPEPGSRAEKRAIDAACSAGLNSLPSEEMPLEIAKHPLLEKWYAIGKKAQSRFVFPARKDNASYAG